MRLVVEAEFIGFTEELEGAVRFMYLDVLGLVTCGYGNLINTPASAAALPWRRKDGSYATRAEILADWALVRSRRDLAQLGGGHFADVAQLRLDDQGVANLVHAKFLENEKALQKRYADYETWPACAQLAVHSLAWACGAAYHFPQMDVALAGRDFDTAAREIEMTPAHNPGNNLKKRNLANEILMRNAQRVESYHLDPDTLAWGYLLGVSDRDTSPELVNPASDPPPPLPPLPLINTPIMGQDSAATLPTCYPSPKEPDDAA